MTYRWHIVGSSAWLHLTWWQRAIMIVLYPIIFIWWCLVWILMWHLPNIIQKARLAVSEWKPGDPCGSCGSRKTGWNPVEGGFCNGCGRCDSDE